MGWYRVIKTVKGLRYAYLQRSWREGKRVRTESRYLGPASGEGRKGGSPDPTSTDQAPVITTPRIAYHGSRTGLEGAPRASEEGTFGPGFYLTIEARAHDYAIYDGKTAANLPGMGDVQLPPQHDGVVYACDLSGLNIKPMSWDGYYALMETLLGFPTGDGIPTPDNKRRVTELLVEQGCDGIQIIDDLRQETVIFPASLHKIRLQPVITTNVDN